MEMKKWSNAIQLTLNSKKTLQIYILTQKNGANGKNTNREYPGTIPSVPISNIKVWKPNWKPSRKAHKNHIPPQKPKKPILFEVLLISSHDRFQSVAFHAILTWRDSCHSYRFFKLLRIALRVITGLSFEADVKQKFIEHRILALPSSFICENLVYAYNRETSMVNN